MLAHVMAKRLKGREPTTWKTSPGPIDPLRADTWLGGAFQFFKDRKSVILVRGCRLAAIQNICF